MRELVRVNQVNGERLRVYEHIITVNWWEFYLLDDNYDGDLRFGLVMGHFTEIGDVYMPEIRPYIRSRTLVDRETELMPAKGWEWYE